MSMEILYDNIEEGKIYKNNIGLEFLILKIESYKKVYVEFIKTGFKKYFITIAVRKGSIKDLYNPTVYNIGFIGDGEYRASYNKIPSKEYALWISMIQRCYDYKCNNYKNYGGKGVTVDSRWHNFQHFCEDLPILENYDKWLNKLKSYDWTLDKDLKSKNNKIYSKNTCTFLNMSDQNLIQDIDRSINGYVDGELLFTFNSIKCASETLNIDDSSISSCCYKNRKSAGKYNSTPIVWRFNDDVEDIIYNRKYENRSRYTFDVYIDDIKIYEDVSSKFIVKDLKLVNKNVLSGFATNTLKHYKKSIKIKVNREVI